jgi:peroxiredoxin
MPAARQYELEFTASINTVALLTDKDRPKEFRVSYKTTRHLFSTDGGSTALYVLSFARDVSVGLVAAGLYDLIKKHATGKSDKMTIDRKTILIEKGQIKKVIEEHIAHEKK